MDLLILRHGVACERDPKRWPRDGDRPLTAAGMDRARKGAAGLRRICEPPALLLTSPLVRARQTAAILTEIAGWPKALECEELAPGAAPDSVFGRLRGVRAARVALVGHQPGLGELLAASLPGPAKPQSFELKKLGLAALRFEGAPRSGRGRLYWLIPPRLLRSAR